MGDPKDEEVGLLSEQVKPSTSAAAISRPEDVSRKTTVWTTTLMTLLIFIAVLAVLMTISHVVEDHAPNPESTFMTRRDSMTAPLNVLVVGDWGREGGYNQTLVAGQMARVGEDLDVDFIISTGDNFYDEGLDSSDDALFEESFSKIYQAPSLQKPWYAVLGNHDYRGNPDVQVDGSLRLRDSRWYCDYTYTLPVDLGHSFNGAYGKMSSYVEFFFMDTNPLEEDYWTPTLNKHYYTWNRSITREVAIANQLKNLTESLQASTATWKVVIGHHTMFSYGSHGNTPELVEKVLPILKANDVNLYINGHDHCLQDIKRPDSEIHFVTSGAGSKAWKGQIPSHNLEDSKLYYDGQGFISLSISPSILQVNYYDITGSIIHQTELKK